MKATALTTTEPMIDEAFAEEVAALMNPVPQGAPIAREATSDYAVDGLIKGALNSIAILERRRDDLLDRLVTDRATTAAAIKAEMEAAKRAEDNYLELAKVSSERCLTLTGALREHEKRCEETIKRETEQFNTLIATQRDVVAKLGRR